MKVLGVLAGIVLAAVVNGFVLKTLWLWFVVPVFASPVLSVPQAMGVSFVAQLFTGTTSLARRDTDKQTVAEEMVTAVLRPLVVLALGWVVTLFL